MAVEGTINDVVAGDTLDITRTITDVPASQVLEKAWLTIKLREFDLDADLLVQLIITSSATSAGQITDTGADGTGVVLFQLSETDTGTTLTAEVWYFYDIQVKTDGAKVSTVEKGRIKFDRGITDTTA